MRQLPDYHLHRGWQPDIVGQRVRHGDPEAARVDLCEVVHRQDRVVGEDRAGPGQGDGFGVLGQRGDEVVVPVDVVGDERELAGQDEVEQLHRAHAESGGGRPGDHAVVVGGVPPQRIEVSAHGRDGRSDHR
ncbi:MAG: hypothetical protein JWP46_3712 [Modestobacter sp.]|nr:hypothetical protein [Modestobacter sp.]